jgi:hypothetical protein
LIALMIDVRHPLQDDRPRSEKTMLANHARANAPCGERAGQREM